MAQSSLRTNALFLGNLNNERPKAQIAAMILQLTRDCTGLALDHRDVKIRYSHPSNCYTATLKLPTPDMQHIALNDIQQCQQVPNGLVKDGRTLRVDVYQKPNRRKTPKNETQDRSADDDLSLVVGQHLGNETRMLEFKEMSNLNLQYLRKTVSRYVCAFLNSSGGALMLGVDDRGNVTGTPMTHRQEDDVRLAIDDTIKKFDPPVLPQMYSVLFIPVLDHDEGTLNDCAAEDCDFKVIKLIVKPGRPDTLYSAPGGEVYIRRDGSIQGPLKPRDVQEWCNVNFRNKEVEYQLQISDLQSKLRQAEYDRQSSSKSSQSVRKTNSAVCSIL
ncbi:schlafen-like protein 1 [Diadema antillarum]|uniref:schlafen-like protein 1 n=1 Tax=Diadema antillarum TaxID=105358 RepID=UPI003A89D2BF